MRVLRTNAQLRRSPEAMAEAQIAFEHTGPFTEKNLRILVQYWLFYRYDEWSAPTILGRLVQRHEGDWEAVTIGFSPDEPLFVAYSAHCAGRWEYWKDIHVAVDVRPATHPLVAVAEGSQANYDNSQERRPPDWASCLGIDGTAFSALSYIWGIEDVTGDDYRLLPTDIRMVDSNEPPMTFPGTWGENARTVIHNFRTFRLGPEGTGPERPRSRRCGSTAIMGLQNPAPGRGVPQVLTRSHRTAERRITRGCRNFVLRKSVIRPGWGSHRQSGPSPASSAAAPPITGST